MVLVIIGLLIAIDQLGITEVNLFFDGWWTLFIIVPCAIELIGGKDKTSSLIGLLVGVVLLLAAQDFISFDLVWKLLFPFILVMIGFSMILNEVFGYKVKEKVAKVEDGKLDNVTAVFNEEARSYDSNFEGAVIDAVFGHAIVNLRNAKMQKETVIKASAIFGAVDIIVPAGVVVKVKATKILGGVDKYNIEDSKKKEEKVVYIEGFALFGGITIK